jgi:hypothetical protein
MPFTVETRPLLPVAASHIAFIGSFVWLKRSLFNLLMLRPSCSPKCAHSEHPLSAYAATTPPPSPPLPELAPPSSRNSIPLQTAQVSDPSVLPGPTREQVLTACAVTSFGIGAAGLALRSAFHAAAEVGLPLNDCSALLPGKYTAENLLTPKK